MRAMQIIEWGKPLEAREYPDPEPKGEEVLLRVEAEDAYAAELLHSEKISSLDARDRNLAMQIVMGALRWQSRLDDELRPFVTSKNAMAKLDAEVRIALRMAAFQLRFLDRIPVSAAER